MRCAYCRSELSRHPRRPVKLATRDHIIPQCEGGHLILRWGLSLPPALRVRNWRWSCEPCNALRALSAHCVGMMACAAAVASSRRMTTRRVLRQWNRVISHGEGGAGGPRPNSHVLRKIHKI